MKSKYIKSIYFLFAFGLVLFLGVQRVYGGEAGTLKWEKDLESGGYSAPAIGLDGTVYVNATYLTALNPTGTIKWSYPVESIYSPSIGLDGVIYVGSYDSYLYAINPDGTLKWKFKTGYSIDSSPAIGSDGTIYVGSDDNYLYAINPDGTLKWRFKTKGDSDCSPSIGSNGLIYYVGPLNFYAINPDGTLKWKYPMLALSSPAIGSDGTIYIGADNSSLYAINPDGTLKWKLKLGNDYEAPLFSSPAIGINETIYIGSDNGYLYAINPDGTLKWKLKLDGGISVKSSPAIGSDGTIYIGAGYYIYAINPDGTLKWKLKLDYTIDSSPTVGCGVIYVFTYSGYLYSIYSDSKGLFGSSWPVLQHDLRHTGREVLPFTSKKYTLYILPPTNGSIEYIYNGEGMFCNSSDESCSKELNSCTIVTMQAIPESGYIFTGWAGDCSFCGTNSKCTIVMYYNKTCKANFEKQENTPPSTPIAPSGPDSGYTGKNYSFSTSTTDPDGDSVTYKFDWGDGSISNWGSGTQSHTWSSTGDFCVKVQAKDSKGATSGWSDCHYIDINSNNVCNTLSTYINPPGGGYVNKNPDKSCYSDGESVTLTAIPNNGYKFSGWGGDCSFCGSSTSCTITVNSSESCAADFEKSQNNPPIIDSFTANPLSGNVPLTVTFTCKAHDPDGNVVEYDICIYYGNGYAEETIEYESEYGTFTHTYNNSGSYKATCTVKDNDGSVASKSIQISVGFASGYTFTPGNDTNYIQNKNLSILDAGKGDDTYIIDPQYMTDDLKVTVIDYQGNNIIRIPNGTNFEEIKVAKNAIEFILENGAVVKVLDADHFHFQLGGDESTGEGSTDQTFEEFVTNSLNLYIPQDNSIVNTGEVSVDNNEIVAP